MFDVLAYLLFIMFLVCLYFALFYKKPIKNVHKKHVKNDYPLLHAVAKIKRVQCN